MSNQYNVSTAIGMPPMTPGNRKKRPMTTPVRSQKKRRIDICAQKSATITPVRTIQTEVKPPRKLHRQQFNTPHRVKVPSLQKHRYGTPISASKAFRTTPTTGGDRFIPNRAKTDTIKARHALTSSKKHRSRENSSNDENGTDYQRELRRVLFGETQNTNGKDEPLSRDENCRVLSFGASSSKTLSSSTATTATKTPSRPIQDPMDLDFLRHTPKNNGKSRPPKVRIERRKLLGAEGMLDDANLSLVSCRNSSYGDDWMATAIEDKVWVSTTTGEGIDLLAEKIQPSVEGGDEPVQHPLPYSTLQWSEAGDLIALGGMDSIEIWCPTVSGDQHDKHLKFRDISIPDFGMVTAIAWKETEIIAAGQDGCLIRIDLCKNDLEHVVYHHGHENNSVTALEWKGHWIVSAGGDTINVFRDDKSSSLPCLVLNHPGVKTVEFSPFQSSLLVSGGDDGLKFWNIHDGSLRATIKTDERVVGTVFLKEHKEVAVAHGNKVSLWSIARQTKLCEITEGGTQNFVNMTGNEKGTLACTGIDNSDVESVNIFVFQVARAPTGRRHLFGPEMGVLQMPVIR